MNSPELMVFAWAGLTVMVLLLCICVWLVIASRRSGRPLPPMLSAQLILILGGATLSVSGVVGGLAALVMAWIGGMLVAFAAGRMWDPLKQHLRNVGLVKANGLADAERRNHDDRLDHAG